MEIQAVPVWPWYFDKTVSIYYIPTLRFTEIKLPLQAKMGIFCLNFRPSGQNTNFSSVYFRVGIDNVNREYAAFYRQIWYARPDTVFTPLSSDFRQGAVDSDMIFL